METLGNELEILIDNEYSSLEEWNLFVLKIDKSKEVEKALKNEASILSTSIWEISEMFQSGVKGH